MGISPVNSRLVCAYIDKVVEAKVKAELRLVANFGLIPPAVLYSSVHSAACTESKTITMRCDTNCLTDWADELVWNESDFSLLSDLIACADDLVNEETPAFFTFTN